MGEAKGVHRLTAGVCNWYVIEDGGRLLLVDAGVPRDWDLLRETVDSMGRSLADLEAVLLTHAHPDHTGFGERVRATTGARVFVHEADSVVARSGKTGRTERSLARYLLRLEAYRTAFSLVRRGGAKIVPILEVSTFSDGDVLDLPGSPRVVHTPGHTPGHSCLHVPGSSALFTGDALVMRNPLTGRVGPQVMPAGLNTSSDEALRSLDALESLEAAVLFPGHGEPWTAGPAEAVRRARLAGPS